jgi:2-keto-3-deoxy-L-rhamnonate aldolase RhmA
MTGLRKRLRDGQFFTFGIGPMLAASGMDFVIRAASRVLDIGARGVMVPRVESRAHAEEIVAQLKYAPAGRRVVALGVAHDLYRAAGPDFFSQANRCRRYGVAPGFLPATPESGAHWICKGFRAISLGSDISVFLNGMRTFQQSVIDSGAGV